MEIKATKTKDGVLLSGSLPQGLSDLSSLEIFQLRDGFYLLASKGLLPPASSSPLDSLLDPIEKEVVRKLVSTQFEKRIPSEIAKAIPKEQSAALERLMQRKLVQLFFGSKYSKEGVYKVSDIAFQQSKEQRISGNLPASSPTAYSSQPGASSAVPSKSAPSLSSPEHLDKFGYMVLDSEGEARNFAFVHPDKIKSGEVRGLRAFDKKFYFVRSPFLSLYEKKISASLGKGDKTSEEISEELGISVEGCRALLLHLCDSGEVLEKHRGKFARA